MFVLSGRGLNDDLNGVEKPVTFNIKDMNCTAEVVHSLAKWKRLTLANYDIAPGYGIYTDMNAIRADEHLDRTHSLYVDQWDWEKTITREDRSVEYLKKTVDKIYDSILRTEFLIYESYHELNPILPEKVFYIHSQELLDMFPDKTPKEREDLICKKYKAVFIIGIGGKLSNGEVHDMRAPDYDDWSSENENGQYGLNGDLLLWSDVLGQALEISSMGVRVDKTALERQLEISGKQDRRHLMFHSLLLNDKLPLSIGGGIGQSRLCMFLLRKRHIGEIQSSIWPEEMRRECLEEGIKLL